MSSTTNGILIETNSLLYSEITSKYINSINQLSVCYGFRRWGYRIYGTSLGTKIIECVKKEKQ